MKVLHLCSYFTTSSLYVNMMNYLKEKVEFQYVYIPLKKNSNDFVKNHTNVKSEVLSSNEITFNYDYIFSNITSKVFYKKIKVYEKNLLKQVNVKTFDLIHAHSLVVNGRIAHKLYIKYQINYIVAVRATDLYVLNKLWYRQNQFYNVLIASKKIICISHAIKDRLIKIYGTKAQLLIDKIEVIPNGIDAKWFDNDVENKKVELDKISIFYMGAIQKRKNIDNIINACGLIANKKYKVELTIIGNGPYQDKLQKSICNQNFAIIKYDWINDFSRLIELISNQNIFVMPSTNETFGLTYVESLSQGKPIIYSKNDGVDGFFNDINIGLSVNPLNENDIADSIIRIFTNYADFQLNCREVSKNFTWEKITEKYFCLYSLYKTEK